MKKYFLILILIISGLVVYLNTKETKPTSMPRHKSKVEKKHTKVTSLKAILKKEKKQISKECVDKKCKREAMVEQLSLIYQKSKSKNVDNMTNQELLASLINPFVGTKGFDGVDFNRLKKIAQKIIDFDDTIYAAYKAKLISDFMPFIMGQKENLGEFFVTLDQMEKFDIEGHDPELYDARAIAILKSKKNELLLGYGNKMLINKPASGLGHYFKAMYYQDKKNMTMTRSELISALDREPSNPKYLSALKGLDNGDSQIFSFSLSFDIEDF